MTQTCADCGRAFRVEDGEEWKTRCLSCFKRHMREQGRSGFASWQRRREPRDDAPGPQTRAATKAVADAYDAGHRAGYEQGIAAGRAESAKTAKPARLDAALIRDAITLCHPDLHPPERAARANAVTARLLAIRGTTRKAA